LSPPPVVPVDHEYHCDAWLQQFYATRAEVYEDNAFINRMKVGVIRPLRAKPRSRPSDHLPRRFASS
jgi:hypothetical protein